jgi:hypothetical protein
MAKLGQVQMLIGCNTASSSENVRLAAGAHHVRWDLRTSQVMGYCRTSTPSLRNLSKTGTPFRRMISCLHRGSRDKFRTARADSCARERSLESVKNLSKGSISPAAAICCLITWEPAARLHTAERACSVICKAAFGMGKQWWVHDCLDMMAEKTQSGSQPIRICVTAQ